MEDLNSKNIINVIKETKNSIKEDSKDLNDNEIKEAITMFKDEIGKGTNFKLDVKESVKNKVNNFILENEQKNELKLDESYDENIIYTNEELENKLKKKKEDKKNVNPFQDLIDQSKNNNNNVIYNFENNGEEENNNININNVNKFKKIIRNNLNMKEQIQYGIRENMKELAIGNNNPILQDDVGNNVRLNDNFIPSFFQQYNAFADYLYQNQRNLDINRTVIHLVNLMITICKEKRLYGYIFNNVYQLLEIDDKNKINIAIKGRNGLDLEQQEIVKKDRIKKLKEKGDFIEPNTWNKMSLIEKINKRFVFKDFRQNPYINIWTRFNIDEKTEFIKQKLNWRIKRMKELLELDNNNNYNLRMINNFFFYEWKDPNGYMINTYDIKDMNFYTLKEEENSLLDKLREILNKANNNRKVGGFIISNGDIIFNKGYSFDNNPQLSKTYIGKKRINSNNRFRGRNNNSFNYNNFPEKN